MSTDIRERCEELLGLIKEYSDCGLCGQIIKDANLLVPDPYNPGRFRSVCPACQDETWRHPFPSKNLAQVFELIAESAEMNRAILVLVLSCTVFEVLVEDLVFRLLERRHTYPEVCEAVMDATGYHLRMRMIETITGKKLKALAKSFGYDQLMKTLEEIKDKRNSFLHGGVAKKVEMVESKFDKKYKFPEFKELDDEDIKQALDFTIDTINCFAKIYTEHGKYIHMEEHEY